MSHPASFAKWPTIHVKTGIKNWREQAWLLNPFSLKIAEMLGIENIYQNGDRRGGYSGPFRYLAFHLALPSTNGQPEKERDWPVTIPRPDGSVIFMVFVAAQAHFERFEPTYAAMLKSVRF